MKSSKYLITSTRNIHSARIFKDSFAGFHATELKMLYLKYGIVVSFDFERISGGFESAMEVASEDLKGFENL